ncbi:hypothetical protein [Litoreibacter albidus]|uniref:Uncharacterized protein n=1 Tax=Litoreibacter albidus TaxID=670155 RepID=A0A1H2Z8K0_9RHOB|nr:hypothetical protein [Litoreibacter albidus]SDX13671.1 hypothetical protein SAMN04488001_2476 [Litoreibacter albidus]
MRKNNRWMTWVLEESARVDVAMPWARGARSAPKARLPLSAPSLSKVARQVIPATPTAYRAVAGAR